MPLTSCHRSSSINPSARFFSTDFVLAAVARASKAKSWLGKDPSKHDVKGEVKFRAAVNDVGQLGFRDLPNAVGKLGG